MFKIFFIVAILTLPASGAVLHIGNYYGIQLFEQKQTSPSIAIQSSSGKTYYASLRPYCGHVKVEHNGSVFGLCDKIQAPYTRLEYLESTDSGEYIDTGIFISPDNINKVKIEVEFSSTYNDGWNIPVGIGYPSPQPYCFVSIGYKQITFGYNGDIYTGVPVSLEQANTFHKYSIDYSLGEIRLDDKVVHNFNVRQFSGNTAQSLYMFTWNTNGSKLSYQYQPLKIKWARISIEGELIRDYIPVLDEAGVPAMYDRVTDSYFYNIGSGQFKYNN